MSTRVKAMALAMRLSAGMLISQIEDTQIILQLIEDYDDAWAELARLRDIVYGGGEHGKS